MPVVTCPTCGQRVAVTSSGATFTCPSCLRPIRVPLPPPPIAPLRVIPVEQQVGRDHRGTVIGLSVIGVALVLGFIGATRWSSGAKPIYVLGFLAAMVMVLLIAGIALGAQSVRRDEAASTPDEPYDPRDESAVLDYGGPLRRRAGGGRASMIGALISTFIAGMIACVGLLLLIILTICGGLFR